MQESKHHCAELEEVRGDHIDSEFRFEVQQISGPECLRTVLFVFTKPDLLRAIIDDVAADQCLLFNLFLVPQYGLQIHSGVDTPEFQRVQLF